MKRFFSTVAALAMFAAPAAAQQDQKFFANINFGYQAQNQDLRQSAEFELYGEEGAWSVDHAIEGGTVFDVSAGYRVLRRLSVGVGYTVRAADSRDVAVAATVPHPIFHDALRTATVTVAGLEHTERAIHLQALYHVPVTVEFDVTLFGGPTIFRATDTFIESVTPVETGGSFSNVDLLIANSRQSNSAAGFHVGLDTRYMLTRMAGVGALLRYSRGSVDAINPAASGGELSLDLGGLEIAAGVRLRF